MSKQSPSISGRLKRQDVSKALEVGPTLVRERTIQPVDPMSLVPENMIQDDVSFGPTVVELEQQREYEVLIQAEIDNQVSVIRESAASNWRKVRAFASQRVDDPARVAVYAFCENTKT